MPLVVPPALGVPAGGGEGTSPSCVVWLDNAAGGGASPAPFNSPSNDAGGDKTLAVSDTGGGGGGKTPESGANTPETRGTTLGLSGEGGGGDGKTPDAVVLLVWTGGGGTPSTGKTTIDDSPCDTLPVTWSDAITGGVWGSAVPLPVCRASLTGEEGGGRP